MSEVLGGPAARILEVQSNSLGSMETLVIGGVVLTVVVVGGYAVYKVFDLFPKSIDEAVDDVTKTATAVTKAATHIVGDVAASSGSIITSTLLGSDFEAKHCVGASIISALSGGAGAVFGLSARMKQSVLECSTAKTMEILTKLAGDKTNLVEITPEGSPANYHLLAVNLPGVDRATQDTAEIYDYDSTVDFSTLWPSIIIRQSNTYAWLEANYRKFYDKMRSRITKVVRKGAGSNLHLVPGYPLLYDGLHEPDDPLNRLNLPGKTITAAQRRKIQRERKKYLKKNPNYFDTHKAWEWPDDLTLPEDLILRSIPDPHRTVASPAVSGFQAKLSAALV